MFAEIAKRERKRICAKSGHVLHRNTKMIDLYVHKEAIGKKHFAVLSNLRSVLFAHSM